MLKLIPIDKANHAVYGTVAGALCACVALLLGAPLAVAGGASLACAALIGWGKELRDRHVNERAEERGEPAPHAVEAGDIKATALGGLAVGAPLVVAELARVAWAALGAG